MIVTTVPPAVDPVFGVRLVIVGAVGKVQRRDEVGGRDLDRPGLLEGQVGLLRVTARLGGAGRGPGGG